MRRAGPGRRSARTPLVHLAILAIVALVPACTRGDAEVRRSALEASTAVTFESADGVRLEGRLFGEGTTGVVLSHMFPADQSSWYDFATRLADEGYLVLTYDFRGYCPGGDAGCSAGDRDVAAIWQDVLGAIDFIRQEGASRVSLLGASMGGTASLIAAAEEGNGVAAMVTLSAPASFEGLVVDENVLTRVTAAKLFVAGVGDAPAAVSAQALYDLSPPPKRVEILASDDHGTDLLSGNQAGPLSTLILSYLAQNS